MISIAPSEKDTAAVTMEKRLWDSADQLRANSGLKAQEYSGPILGIIFLRFAEVRFAAQRVKLEKTSASSRRGSRVDEPAAFIDTEFLFHWFRANTYEILGRADEAGHGTKRLETDRLLALPISVPPLPVQRRIAGILSAYDELMENSQRRIRIVEAMARALYREWFVHFRYPRHEKVPMVLPPLVRA